LRILEANLALLTWLSFCLVASQSVGLAFVYTSKRRYFTIDFDSQIIFYSHSTSQKKAPGKTTNHNDRSNAADTADPQDPKNALRRQKDLI
jgi:hypothetical protein